MSDPKGNEPEQTLRSSHATRTRSAASRAAAICHYIERHGSAEKHEAGTAEGGTAAGVTAEVGPAAKEIAWKAAHAARVAAQAFAVLSESAPAPAADSRCARNAAASAAQAAQMGQLHDGDGELSVAACRAAVHASRAAAEAAGAQGLGVNETLNASADAAEAAAVAAAEEAGWMRPGQDLPQVSTGLRSPEIMSMLHL
ncbi:hypothetical protein OG548_20295 [Streptomyces sp. NBC_01356]|uniref:hypothetical protein n=1 Tax=Streptomyces sp. NBC_01356 TaxID=2903836 RepID=UPI002E36059C|nr:hypothetical protein [Streptomyces sp. NBC_01356]